VPFIGYELNQLMQLQLLLELYSAWLCILSMMALNLLPATIRRRLQLLA